MKNTTALLSIGAMFAASAAHAAIISISDTSLVPDGTNAQQVDQTQINVLNDGGADVLPNVNGTVVFYVTTVTFGENSDAHFISRFNATGGQNRLGIEVQDTGLIQFVSSGDPGRTNVNLGTDLAGETLTFIIKQHYDSSNDSLRATLNTGDDTLMNVWVNPDINDVEGSGLSAGDMHTLWNSHTYRFFTQTIQNQSTPGTAGTSTISDTVILTGSDATFANALFYAGVVPEPSALALTGLGGLLLLRRHRK